MTFEDDEDDCISSLSHDAVFAVYEYTALGRRYRLFSLDR